MRTWKSIVLKRDEYDRFRKFLKEHNITYEPSGYWNSIHVSLFVNDNETEMCQKFLDNM